MTFTNCRRLFAVAAAVLLVTSARPASADVKLPKVFGSYMVLQRDAPIPIWGWAEPGEDVTISVGDASERVTTSADGGWVITLPAMKAGGPHSITVKGNNEIELTNVLVGEVWVGSGQSNMAGGVAGYAKNDHTLAKLVDNAPYPSMRLMRGGPKPKWVPADKTGITRFSAILFAFGERLQRSRTLAFEGCP